MNTLDSSGPTLCTDKASACRDQGKVIDSSSVFRLPAQPGARSGGKLMNSCQNTHLTLVASEMR